MTAAAAHRKLPEEVWNSYLKFCVERNPWDRVISNYFYHRATGKIRAPLSEWISTDEIRQISNTKIYTVDGRVAVDRLLRHEHLTDELRGLLFPYAFESPKHDPAV